MSHVLSSGLGLSLGLVLIAVSPTTRTAPARNDGGPAKPAGLFRQITLTLSTPEAFLGSTVRLTETIPVGVVAEVRTFGHEAFWIARYDPETDEMIPLDGGGSERAEIETVFPDLPWLLCGSHAGELPELTPRTRGIEFEFKAKRIGTFLIRATWGGDSKGKVYGTPVVLTVRPPTDEKGRPIVKPEWLKDWE